MQLRKEIEELTTKLGQQQTAVQDSKENIKQEVIKEEENSNTDSNVQVKEEPTAATVPKKEGEEEAEVRVIILPKNNVSLIML